MKPKRTAPPSGPDQVLPEPTFGRRTKTNAIKDAELKEGARLLKLLTKGRLEWDGKREPAKFDGEPDPFNGCPYVPQGSHLGETLICLDDTYENSAQDCAAIEWLVKYGAKLVKELQAQRKTHV